MKIFKLTAFLLAAAGAISLAQGLPLAHASRNIPGPFTLPASAIKIADNLYYLGVAKDTDGRVVEGYAILHPKHENSKPATSGAGKPGGTTCYSFLSKGARWKTTETFVFNPANSDGMNNAFVTSALGASATAWDTQVSFNLFGSGMTTSSTLVADSAAPDGVNETYFGSIANSNTIAVTTTWGIFGGPIDSRELVEWDMVFNDPDYSWGDAASNTNLMDLQNVATHEIGHAAGMGHPSNTCAEETMYAFADTGEIKKRDLNTGDRGGIKKLYGN
ncbi:MAG: matrixin family metalloprotease [Patescibacteria group bacterium]|mgnify:CR=1 FL=1